MRNPTHATLSLPDPLSILRSPRTRNHRLEADVSRKMAQYFAEVYGCPWRDVQRLFPETVVRWGKVRIANDGDNIRGAIAVSATQALTCRDASFVRVSVTTSNQLVIY